MAGELGEHVAKPPKTYDSAPQFQAALTQAARNAAKQTGLGISELMNIFYFNRLSARVFAADPDGWLIKGGQALLVRYDKAARLSRDIDLQSIAAERTSDEAVKALVDAAAADHGDDFLSFVPLKYVPSSDDERGGTQHFKVFSAAKEVATIKVDIAVGRPLAGVPETRALKPAVDVPWPVDWPDVRLYPVIDHMADKICAMYERHRDGASNRYRDLADLLLLTQQEPVDGPRLHDALHAEADRRRGLRIDLTLPKAFEAPGPDWERGYPTAAAAVLGLRGCRTFAEASSAADTFATPLLDATVRGTWNPETSSWN